MGLRVWSAGELFGKKIKTLWEAYKPRALNQSKVKITYTEAWRQLQDTTRIVNKKVDKTSWTYRNPEQKGTNWHDPFRSFFPCTLAVIFQSLKTLIPKIVGHFSSCIIGVVVHQNDIFSGGNFTILTISMLDAWKNARKF